MAFLPDNIKPTPVAVKQKHTWRKMSWHESMVLRYRCVICEIYTSTEASHNVPDLMHKAIWR